MYDFEGDGTSSGTATAAGGPPRALLLLELPRWLGEYSSSRVLDAVTDVVGPGATRGQGRPVLVLPGFSATDQETGRLRDHLRRRGFAVHGWEQGRNIGLIDKRIDGLIAKFESLVEQYDEPISIVGWSFGGVLARWLAHTYPQHVRQIVCLGSPWRAEGEKTRATAMFERSRRKYGLSDRALPMVELMRGPVPVPVTAVWSKTDGIVPWRGCRVDEVAPGAGAVAENVAVPSSHVGMVANPLVLDVVVDRLCQNLEDWRSFTWREAIVANWTRSPR